MLKLGIYGDSFGDPTHGHNDYPEMSETGWPSLLKRQGFIQYLNTPIVKATKGKETIVFYNLMDYEKWKESGEANGYKVKYYKGLGTSTAYEAKRTFTDFAEKQINFVCGDVDDKNDEKSDDGEFCRDAS